MQAFYYSINIFQKFFWQKDKVGLIFNTLTVDEYELVYNDPQYGLSNNKTLVSWVQACLNYTNETAMGDEANLIVDHFASRGVILTTAQMATVIAKGSDMY